MGTDRIHHAFWKFFDPTHHKYEFHPEFSRSISDYCQYLDQEIGQILQLVDENTTIFVISAHGARRMDGGICINEWLIKKGLLTLRTRPQQITPISKCEIDWSRTKVWGNGGHYGRISFNIEGRDPQGIVKPEEVISFGIEPGDEAILLRSVAVHPAYRRQGWGRKIVTYILDIAKDQGYRYIYLFSTDAGDYWIKQGFYEASVHELARMLPHAYQVTRLQRIGQLELDAAWRRDLVS
jgi:GNAT superfamily N-acetyltransferase